MFKALLKACHRTMELRSCELDGYLGYWKAGVLIRDNVLELAWQGKQCHERIQDRVVTLLPRSGTTKKLRFAAAAKVDEFAKVVKANNMRQGRDFKFAVTDEKLLNLLFDAGFRDPSSQFCARDAAEQPRVGARQTRRGSGAVFVCRDLRQSVRAAMGSARL